MSEKLKPISPQEAFTSMVDYLPDYVIEATNQLIKEKYVGAQFTIKQEELVNKIIECAAKLDIVITSHEIYNKHYLDIENVYIKEGWSVEYDKPGYNESYSAFYKFKPKK